MNSISVRLDTYIKNHPFDSGDSECEPDFVAFKVWADGFNKSKELLEWYADLFLIQSAVMPMDDCDISAIPADFAIKNDK